MPLLASRALPAGTKKRCLVTQWKNQVEVLAICTQRINAIEAHVPPKAQIAIDGVVHKPSAVTALFQASIDMRSTLAALHAQVKVARAAVEAADAKRIAVERGLGPWVKGQFGVDSHQALAFGFGERPRAVRSLSDKARSAELALATRKARGTMSKKARAKIKGVLPPIEVASGAPPPRGPNGVAPHAANGVAPDA